MGRNNVFTSAVFRVVVIVLAVVIPLNLLTLILGNSVITEVERQVSLETQNALDLYMSQVDDAMGRISTALFMLARDDPDYARLAEKPDDSSAEHYRQLQALVRLNLTLQDEVEDNTLIGGAFAWFPEKGYLQFQGGSDQQNTELEGYLTEKGLERERGWTLLEGESGPYLVYTAVRQQSLYGAWISLRDLAYEAGLFDGREGAYYAFTDSAGKVYMASGEGPETLDLASAAQKLDGETYTLVRARSARSELCYVQMLSKSEIANALPMAIRVMQVLSVVAVLIIPVIVVALRRWVIRPVNLLTGAMERIEQGDVDYRIPKSTAGSEFDRINSSFNHMMDEVSELKISMYEQQIKAERVRLGFLSRQIQPHFILNALNILYSYEPEEFQLSQKMILCLSKYFRYVVNANEDFVELGQELNHIRNYFEIQQARFISAFRSEVVCGEDVEDCLIPPLIVQNFTENAIKYALVPDRIVHIAVRAERAPDGRLHVAITDDGPGISDEALAHVAAFRQSREFRMDLGVGIQNSIDRLDLIYGDQASLDISRRDGGGTCIDIVLPIRMKGEALP